MIEAMTSGGHSKEINLLCRSPVCDDERNFSSNTHRIKISLTQICMGRNELTSPLRRAKIRDLIEMSLGPFEYNTDSSWSALELESIICCIRCSTIFSELVQNILNWYSCNCTGLFLSTV